MSARRAAMWVMASGVALIAAIVSYGHISDVGRAHGGTGLAPWLLPLSVDMLIIVGELMLLHEADARGRRFPLGWVLVWSGILATLAANVTYGAQFGWLGALIWGWPAYSFVLAAGGMVAIVRRSAAPDDAPASHDVAPASHEIAGLSQSDAIRLAIGATGSREPGDVAEWLGVRGLTVARQRVSDVRRRDARRAPIDLDARRKTGSG